MESTASIVGSLMNTKHAVEWELDGATAVLVESLPQCYILRHMLHVTWQGIEPNAGRNH
jgi:hypothetical protein